MSKRDDRLKRLARRAEYLEKRIAGGVVSGKDLTWDKGEASALRFVLQHVEDLEADLTAAREDVARMDALGAIEGIGLISDDFGHWAVSGCGFQNVPDDQRTNPQEIGSTFWVEGHEWRNSVREAIDAYLAARAGGGR